MSFFQNNYGESIALMTALCWSFTALFFESAGKRIGSLSLNLIRLLIAFIYLSIYTYFTRGLFFPVDAGIHQWGWLLFSGFIGFYLGDLFLFKGFITIGARISMLIYSLVPPMTAIIGWLILGETLTGIDLLGMAITLLGVSLVILQKGDESNKKLKLSRPLSGILFAFGGAVGQAFGLIISKFGMENYNAFAATQIRTIAGIVPFFLTILILGRIPKLKAAFINKEAMGRIFFGAFFGPFLGVSLSLIAIQHIATGVASTVMSIVPVLLIPLTIIFFKEKIKLIEVIGALIAVSGVAILFLF
ncbi:MAG: DMT family transporter [Candidatus Delongbacteria bacterium]|nr:DMT family transporter [Candidatus Delongbacteria bacterium]MBN2836008.1 DMT family transporter [Candidatus Delongbacteria bacterium]